MIKSLGIKKPKNYSEIIVERILFDLLKNYTDICTCDKCLTDIMALALNNVQPRYVSSEIGEVYTNANLSLDNDELITMTIAVVSAIEKVSKAPHH